MKLAANLARNTLEIEGRGKWEMSCNVRSLANGRRRADEVVRSVPDGKPYDPRPFPCGLWNITGVERAAEFHFDEKTYGPVKIRTDAWQSVPVWEVDGDGDYLRETAERARDSGYLLHYSQSSTTLGCIRLASAYDAETIGRMIHAALQAGEDVRLEVV